jgi:gamma-glutamylcyclotransferase (GGCT)/AIG2-like uncharacterized protein YtfP
MEYIFVYGVFRDAGKILIDNSIHCGEAFVFGNMYMVDEFYPGFIRSSNGHKIRGDVYLLEKSLFESLDEYEGDDYNRVKIWAMVNNYPSPIHCWIYEYNKDISNFKEIKSGDWLLR